MIRNALFGLTACVALALAGCTDPLAARQDEVAVPPQVFFTDRGLERDVVITIPQAARVGAGQLLVNVTIRNKTGSDIPLDYSYRFMSNGIEVEAPSGYHHLMLPAHGYQAIQFTSMTAQGNDFGLTIRPAR